MPNNRGFYGFFNGKNCKNLQVQQTAGPAPDKRPLMKHGKAKKKPPFRTA
jgi:hypothetical protein